jgi:hypothetical protein
MDITQELVSQCHSFAELTRKLGRSPHNRFTHKLRNQLIKSKISFDHFTLNGSVSKVLSERVCPICKTPFTPKYDNEQVTCSYSCSNTYFARKRNKPERYKSYKKICFFHHPKKCIVCGEDKIVEVHHMDENNKNNDPKNLIPLCPTHHQYWHSRYRDLVRNQILDFISKTV